MLRRRSRMGLGILIKRWETFRRPGLTQQRRLFRRLLWLLFLSWSFPEPRKLKSFFVREILAVAEIPILAANTLIGLRAVGRTQFLFFHLSRCGLSGCRSRRFCFFCHYL